jgi:hypothetical protein
MSSSRRRRGSAGASTRAANPPAPPSRARKGRAAARNRPAPRTGPDFWSGSAELAPLPASLRITTEPSAVVRSLGRPPLGGHEVAAEHYLRAVYDRAVNLATALAAVGDLIEVDETG